MSGRWWSAPAYLILAALGVALAVLLMPIDGDGSYTCRGSALSDVISAEPQGNAAFRASFFDSGWACNHQARHQVESAGAVLTVVVAASAIWAIARRRNLIDWRRYRSPTG